MEGLSRVGGVDLSFVKGTDDACAGLVVCSYPDLEVVYEKFKMVGVCDGGSVPMNGFDIDIDFF